jgi:hypothetical protein
MISERQTEIARSPQLESLHHRITWGILHPSSPMRSQVELLGQGVSFAELDRSFRLVVMPWLFIVIVERSIEGRHSIVQRAHVGRIQRAQALLI